MTSNYSEGERKSYVNERKKLTKQSSTSFHNLQSQNLLNVPRQPNSHQFVQKHSYDGIKEQFSFQKKHRQNSRGSQIQSFHPYYPAQTVFNNYSQSKQRNNIQKNLKRKQLIQQIDKKLSELNMKHNGEEFKCNLQKIINELKTLFHSIKTIDQHQNLDQQLFKSKQQIKLLEAENNQLKTKLEKNMFMQKKQLKNIAYKDKYEQLKEKLDNVVNRSRRNLQFQSEKKQDLETQIQNKIQSQNLDLQLQGQATVIAQEVAKIYLELDQIIKDNHLTTIFYPNQLNQVGKKIQMLVDSKTYEKIITKLKLTKSYHMLPELTERRQAQLHFLYQDIIEKLIHQIQNIKEKYTNDFEQTMKQIASLNQLSKGSIKNISQRRSSIHHKDQKSSRKSTAQDNKLDHEELFNSETIQAYNERIKELQENYDKIMRKNQELEAQLEEKSQNSQANYIHELIYQIACFLPLQDIQSTMFRPQTDADCVSMLYEIRFFAKKYEQKQKQMDCKVQQFEKRMVTMLKKLIEHYNIPKTEIMAQINLWSCAGNLRNLIHQYYHSKQSPERRRYNTVCQELSNEKNQEK